ncbi:MAG: hypothetical protein J5486_02590 [Bacteroidaceae bacterium]|nr:hypothetical protein [Bacteroidaceae bacterium]
MKRSLLTFAFAALTLGAYADEWQQPAYTGGYAELSETDTAYLYSVSTHQFYTYGNDYGTHATIGAEGIPVRCLRVETDEDYEGPAIYQLRDYHPVKWAWYYAFLTNTTISGEAGDIIHLYTDGAATQPDRYFSFESAGEARTFRIHGAALNANYLHNDTAYADYYLAVNPDYIDDYHGSEQTGTGIVYASASELTDNVWAWVSQTDYAAYAAEIARYNHAQELRAMIEEAEDMGINVSEFYAAYANTSMSYDDITATINALEAAMLKYYEENVSPTNPIDLTRLIPNAGFEEGMDGWMNEAGISTFEQGSWSAMIDGTYMTGSRYLNLWNGSAIQGRIYTRLEGLPTGIYVITMAAYTNRDGAQVFAGDYRIDIEKNTENPYGRDYSVTTLVTDGVLEFGYYCDHDGDFWSCLDNCRLTYYGAGEDAYAYWIEQSLADAPSFDGERAQESLIFAYNDALEALRNADYDEGLLDIVKNYIDALTVVSRNVQAYNALEEAQAEAQNQVGMMGGNYDEQVGKYLSEVVDPALNECKLGTDEVLVIREQLLSLIREGMRVFDLISDLSVQMDALTTAMDKYQATCSAEAFIAAQALYEETAEKMFNETFEDNEEIEAYMQRIDAAIRELMIPVVDPTDDNPIEYTFLLQNPGFEDSTNNWQTYGALSDADTRSWDMDGTLLSGSAYLNLWDAQPNGFIAQTVTDLPNGICRVSASVFTNTANSTWLFAGEDNVLAEATERPSSGVQELEVYTRVTDGTLTLGIILYHPEEAAWSVIDNFTITCYGEDSQHEVTGSSCEGAEALITGIRGGDDLTNYNLQFEAGAVYDLSGRRTNGLRRGLNIVRTANGTTRKVIIP